MYVRFSQNQRWEDCQFQADFQRTGVHQYVADLWALDNYGW